MTVMKNLGKWQYYVHFIIDGLFLTLFVFFWYWASKQINLSQNMFIQFSYYFIGITIALFIIDTIVHLIFGALPGKAKWVD